MSYDTKCGELASSWLPTGANPEFIRELAQTIQGTIEDWISDKIPHNHTCQQCDKVVIQDCECWKGNYMTWCSSNCRAAYDL